MTQKLEPTGSEEDVRSYQIVFSFLVDSPVSSVSVLFFKFVITVLDHFNVETG